MYTFTQPTSNLLAGQAAWVFLPVLRGNGAPHRKRGGKGGGTRWLCVSTPVGPRLELTRADVGLAACKARGRAAGGSLTSCLPSAALSRTGRPMHAPADFMLLSDSCARPARSILGTLSSPASPRRSHRTAPLRSAPPRPHPLQPHHHATARRLPPAFPFFYFLHF